MKIGIDIDGVIAKNSISNWMEKIKSKYPEFQPKKISSYSIETLTGIDGVELLDMFAESILEKDPEVYENCIRVIHDLISSGNDVYIITSRSSEDLAEHTTEWLKKLTLVPKCHLVFCNGVPKHVFAKENKLDIVIDDNILEYINDSSKTYSVIIFSQEWNQTFNLKGDMIIVNSWEEIEEEIANIMFMKKELRVNVRNRRN